MNTHSQASAFTVFPSNGRTPFLSATAENLYLLLGTENLARFTTRLKPSGQIDDHILNYKSGAFCRLMAAFLTEEERLIILYRF